MSKIIAYKNTFSEGKFCQIKFDDGVRVLISLTQTEIKIFKLDDSLMPVEELFDISTLDLFSDKYKRAREKLTEKSLAFDMLDVFKEILIECRSLEEALKTLSDIFQKDENSQFGWSDMLEGIKDDNSRKYMEKTVLYFMQFDKIDYLKFRVNLKILTYKSISKFQEYLKKANLPDVSFLATPSIEIVANPIEQGSTPGWFLAAYPDVELWYVKLPSVKHKEIMERKLSLPILENNFQHLRRIVDAYLENHVLECSGNQISQNLSSEEQSYRRPPKHPEPEVSKSSTDDWMKEFNEKARKEGRLAKDPGDGIQIMIRSKPKEAYRQPQVKTMSQLVIEKLDREASQKKAKANTENEGKKHSIQDKNK